MTTVREPVSATTLSPEPLASQSLASQPVAAPARSATTWAFLGPGEPDHLSTDSPFTIRSSQVLRLLTRGLFGYRAGEVTPSPDVAVELPTVANGGVSDDGRTYRLRLRRGVFWDAQGARAMTAGDFVRGLKRVALPTAARSYDHDARRYFADTIDGLREYCDAYAAHFGETVPTAPDLAQFSVAHDVAGLRALDAETMEIRLVEPANDFLHILATGLAAAAPREYDYYLPDSPALHRNAPSAGPYRISRMWSRGRVLVLEPNPRWDPQTDPLRRRAVDMIHIGPGRGEYDLAWPYTTVSWAPTEHGSIPGPLGYGLGPYLVVNVSRARRGGVFGQPAVRRAVAYAVDKTAVHAAVTAIPGVAAVVQHGLLPPGSAGYGEAQPMTPEQGDPDRAWQELAFAGFPNGIRVTLAVRDTELDRRAAAALCAGLARGGIRLEVQRLSAAMSWDLALDSHTPDWYGNNARTAVVPIVHGVPVPGAANRAGYHNPVVDRLMSYALRDPDEGRAADLWRKVDALVMADLPVIPILAHACGPCTAAADAAPRTHWFAD